MARSPPSAGTFFAASADLPFALSAVIPGRAVRREPGIDNPRPWVWIPGSLAEPVIGPAQGRPVGSGPGMTPDGFYATVNCVSVTACRERVELIACIPPAKRPSGFRIMRRYDCLEAIAPLVADSLVITNLANTATEWRSVRPHEGNLYFVGMGMVTPYALGLALALPHRPVLALDGDGGILFDLSVFGVLAQNRAPNLCVVIFDNEGYVSTGKWPSIASLTAGPVDIEAVARASGIASVCTVRTVDEFVAAVEAAYRGAGPSLIVAKVNR